MKKQSECFYIHDNTYGYFKLPFLIKKLVDTPQFQRLRRIKQLGVASYVYMSANHTRFEHCIGTAYITYKLIRSLRRHSQPDNLITEEEELCLIIAGLCHDLGHGPFSHVFEKVVDKEWSHENMSIAMFDHMVNSNPDLAYELKRHNIDQGHLNLIKNMIIGVKDESLIPECTLDGEIYKKNFLFEIVANSTHGIDTDKIDYLTRDCRNLGFSPNFSHRRFIDNMRIMKDGSNLHVCFNEKLLCDCHSLLLTRVMMFKNVYFHKTVQAIECMVVKAIKYADRVLHFKTRSWDPLQFQSMTDDILFEIVLDKNFDLNKSKSLVMDLFARRLYKVGGVFQILDPRHNFLCSQLEYHRDKLKQELQYKFPCPRIDDLDLEIVDLCYQKGKELNPVDRIRFIKKNTGEVYRCDPSVHSNTLPKYLSEKYLFVFYRYFPEDEAVAQQIEQFLSIWWAENSCAENSVITPHE